MDMMVEAMDCVAISCGTHHGLRSTKIQRQCTYRIVDDNLILRVKVTLESSNQVVILTGTCTEVTKRDETKRIMIKSN
jgi:hypothetical protein